MIIALWVTTVTGLHDMDEFVQSQLILAVSFYSFVYLHLTWVTNHVLSLMICIIGGIKFNFDLGVAAMLTTIFLYLISRELFALCQLWHNFIIFSLNCHGSLCSLFNLCTTWQLGIDYRDSCTQSWWKICREDISG
jgi:hypothetical protein